MEFEEMMHAQKESEDEHRIVYCYGHLSEGRHMTGKLAISNTEYPSVSTLKLEDGYTTRVNEMRIGAYIILQHQLTGEWPDKARLK